MFSSEKWRPGKEKIWAHLDTTRLEKCVVTYTENMYVHIILKGNKDEKINMDFDSPLYDILRQKSQLQKYSSTDGSVPIS